MARCKVCFRHCELDEGQTGFCGARICSAGTVKVKNYGKLSSTALDPIEKKPLSRFFPGSMILSVGSCGCNLRCPFCQNSEISWSQQAMKMGTRLTEVSPQELVGIARNCKDKGNIGIAYTYNEPLVSFEYIRDTAKLVRQQGMVNVIVTNGCFDTVVLDELSDLTDAMNIDLKCFNADTYKNRLGGDLDTVRAFIERAVGFCHVELTTLVVPGISDNEKELRELVSWVARLGKDVPLHLTRFFPRFAMTDCDATDIALIHRFADIAREKLKYVYIGNC